MSHYKLICSLREVVSFLDMCRQLRIFFHRYKPWEGDTENGSQFVVIMTSINWSMSIAMHVGVYRFRGRFNRLRDT